MANRFELIELDSDLPSTDGQAIVRNTLIEQIKAADALRNNGDWVPACGGTEVPFMTRSGRKLLYCWQPTTGRHAYLDMGTDIILSDEEFTIAMAIF